VAVTKTQGINLEGIEDVFRICGWQTGKAALEQRIAEYVEATDGRIQGFLKDMAKYDKERLQGSPASDNNDKVVKMPVKRGRPKKAAEMIGKTFLYKAKRGETNNRLQKLYAVLVQMGWIAADTQQRDFIDLFTGEESYARVVWLDDVNVLAELFRELVTRKKYISLPNGYSIWVMVNAHFWNKNGNKEFGNDRLRCTTAPIDKMQTIKWLVRLLDPNQDLDALFDDMTA
jgi:hypothetical protein